MVAPITWRNVDAPDLRGVGALMGLAQSGIQSGFDKLGEVVKSYEDTDKANWEQQKINNTNELKNLLYSAKTPEEAQAIQNQIAERLSALGAQVDAESVRTAADNRVPELQKRWTANRDYTTAVRTEKEKPQRDALIARIMNKDYVGATADLGSLDLQDEAALYKAIQDSQRVDKQDKYADDEHTWKGRKLEDDLLTNAAQRASARASAAASTANVDLIKANTERVKHEIDKDKGDGTKFDLEKALKARDAAREGTPLSGGYLNTQEGQKNLWSAFSNMKHIEPETRTEIMDAVGKAFPGGEFVTKDKEGNPVKGSVPVSMLVNLIESTQGDGWVHQKLGGYSAGEKVVNSLKTQLSDPNFLALMQADAQNTANLTTAAGIKYGNAAMRVLQKEGLLPDTDSLAVTDKALPTGAEQLKQAIQASASPKGVSTPQASPGSVLARAIAEAQKKTLK